MSAGKGAARIADHRPWQPSCWVGGVRSSILSQNWIDLKGVNLAAIEPGFRRTSAIEATSAILRAMRK